MKERTTMGYAATHVAARGTYLPSCAMDQYFLPLRNAKNLLLSGGPPLEFEIVI